jgi:hypothetical protein
MLIFELVPCRSERKGLLTRIAVPHARIYKVATGDGKCEGRARCYPVVIYFAAMRCSLFAVHENRHDAGRVRVDSQAYMLSNLLSVFQLD